MWQVTHVFFNSLELYLQQLLIQLCHSSSINTEVAITIILGFNKVLKHLDLTHLTTYDNEKIESIYNLLYVIYKLCTERAFLQNLNSCSSSQSKVKFNRVVGSPRRQFKRLNDVQRHQLEQWFTSQRHLARIKHDSIVSIAKSVNIPPKRVRNWYVLNAFVISNLNNIK